MRSSYCRGVYLTRLRKFLPTFVFASDDENLILSLVAQRRWDAAVADLNRGEVAHCRKLGPGSEIFAVFCLGGGVA